MNVMGRVEKLPEFFCCLRGINLVNGVNGLTRGQVMGRRSNPTDPWNDPGKFLHRSSHTEDFKSSQLRNLKVSIFNIPLVVQKNFDLSVSFQSGDRIDGYLLHGNLFFLNAEAGKPNR